MNKIFNPDYLQHLASKYGLDPSKKYGQNYLIDEEVIQRILEISDLKKTDTVVEVGPGFGVLTLPLSERVGEVIAFEIEKKLEGYWTDRVGHNIKIVWGNILYQFPEAGLNNYKIVANLPYQITSAVIRLFLEAENAPKEMILMVQKEVAERICAVPGDMSLLSLSVQYFAEPKLEFVVNRSCFWPSPEVDSAVISIKNIKKTDLKEAENLFKIAKIGFANRRKLLKKNLEPILGKKNRAKLEQIFEGIGLASTVRAQELSVEQWKALAKEIYK